MLNNTETLAFPTKDRAVRYADVLHSEAPMIRWHIEGPEKFLDLESRRIRWSQEGGDSVPVAGLAACPRHNEGVLRVMNPGIPGLLPVQDPIVSVSNADRFHMGRIRSVCRFRDRHGPAPTAARHGLEPFFFLRVTSVVQKKK